MSDLKTGVFERVMAIIGGNIGLLDIIIAIFKTKTSFSNLMMTMFELVKVIARGNMGLVEYYHRHLSDEDRLLKPDDDHL